MDILLLHLIKLDELIYIKKYFFFIFYFLAGQPAVRQGGLTYSTQIIKAGWPASPRLKLDPQRGGLAHLPLLTTTPVQPQGPA